MKITLRQLRRIIREAFNKSPMEEDIFSQAIPEIINSPIAEELINWKWSPYGNDEEYRLQQKWEDHVLNTLIQITGDEYLADDLFWGLTVRLAEKWPGIIPPFFPSV